MADGDEQTVHRLIVQRAGDGVAQLHAGDALGLFAAQHFGDFGVVQHPDLGIGVQARLVGLVGAQEIAAMHQRHLVGEVGEEHGFFNGRVAAADHRHFLAAIEKAVAGGAGRHAEALILAFAFQPQPVGGCAGGDHQRIGGVDVAAVAPQREGAARQVDLCDGVADELGAQILGLFLHLVHQPGALNGVREAGIVFDLCGDGELAAGLDARDQRRLQHGAGGVDRGSAAGGAAAQNDHFGMLGGGLGGHVRLQLALRHLRVSPCHIVMAGRPVKPPKKPSRCIRL